jgi:hypothetical protein
MANGDKKDKKEKDPKKDFKEKDAKPPAQAGSDKFYQYLAEIIAILFIMYFAAGFLDKLVGTYLNRGGTGSSVLDSYLNSLYYWFQSFALYFTIAANALSVFLIMGIVYTVIRLTELNKAQDERINQAHMPKTPEEEDENKQWARVTDHINSENPSDWRLAILEADIMLDDLLTKIGCTGKTIGDKLQQVDKSDFNNIDKAWEAHKVRNMIAHEGQEFMLSKREAQRVIRLYEDSFREFHYI